RRPQSDGRAAGVWPDREKPRGKVEGGDQEPERRPRVVRKIEAGRGVRCISVGVDTEGTDLPVRGDGPNCDHDQEKSKEKQQKAKAAAPLLFRFRSRRYCRFHLGSTLSPCPFGPDCVRGAAGSNLLQRDRKSTRLNSSHVKISYAV